MTGPQHDITRVAVLAEQGMTKSEIAKEMGVCLLTIANYAKRLGVTIQRSNAPPKDPSDRTKRMITMYQQGVILEKIGQQFKITRERVRQLLSKHGICAADGGQHKMAAINRDKKNRQKEARSQLRYGLPIEVVQQLRKDGVIRAYLQQEQSSRRRGIAWKFDFATWFAIWQTSGKLHLRGQGVGKYVMSRLKDDGPYELGNVHIQLGTDNSREGFAKSIGKAKENSGVFLLYPGREKAWLAKYGEKSLGFFKTEQEAVAARIQYLKETGKTAGRRLGCGKGYSITKSGNYIMQCAGAKNTIYKTPEEARAAYLAAVETVKAERLAHLASITIPA